MKKIAVVGSMNMDYVLQVSHMPKVGETLLSRDLKMVPGGKG
ncbi:MAG: ribokinase, partial [Bacilli bacterium]|nr:ribokinase [Bacilli bacterium]